MKIHKKYNTYDCDKNTSNKCIKPLSTPCESGWMFSSGKCVLFPSGRNIDLS